MIGTLLAVVLLGCTVGMGLLMWFTDRRQPPSPAEEAAVRALRTGLTDPVTVASQLERLETRRNLAAGRAGPTW